MRAGGARALLEAAPMVHAELSRSMPEPIGIAEHARDAYCTGQQTAHVRSQLIRN